MNGQVDYDKENDVLYVQFSDAEVKRTKSLDDLRFVDYAVDGSVIGVEFIGASEGVGVSDLPNGDKITPLLAAAGLDFPIRTS